MIDPREVEQFRAMITRRLGLHFDDAKLGFLDEVLRRRLSVLGVPAAAYMRRLDEQRIGGEAAALAAELTVPETYFFRNREQFRAFAEIVLPARMRARAGAQSLRLLSAGCASGEEAYSMAIVARETVAEPGWQVSIRAVDINPAVLERARGARFSAWALRETPPEAQAKWFTRHGRDMVLDPSIRDAVAFEARNLVAEDGELWQPEAYDAIWCRNVLMYFAPERAAAVVDRIARALAPGGYLFLGHAETLRGLSDEFLLRHTHGTFYYERKGGAGEIPVPAHASTWPAAPSSPAAPIPADAWMDVIRDASQRIAALVPAQAQAAPAASAPAWDMAKALDLLRREDFTAALAYVRELPAATDRDPDVLLLEAMLLVHRGALGEAEAACRCLLGCDGLNAGAHYVLALCRERQHDRAGATEHDRVAVYLDPAFAMPRLHLGLLAREAGDRDAARRELGQALVLLRREDASRLLLFGGGFTREALLTLCAAALRECGGQA